MASAVATGESMTKTRIRGVSRTEGKGCENGLGNVKVMCREGTIVSKVVGSTTDI